MTHEYTVVLEPCEDEPGFVATVPALPGCITQGDSLDEALTNVRDAISLWIRDGLAHGEPIPRDESVVRRVKVSVDSIR
jgi:predicted RNase H-like HicB family nuclease